MIQRGMIVARIKPGAQDKVAELFAESDAGELPRLAGVRHICMASRQGADDFGRISLEIARFS
jgi:Polyketide synthesis cyclase